jgi:hypothetical protein
VIAAPEPVLIRGVRYPSMGAAARALGVTRRAIVHALDEGTPDRVGTGKSQPRKFIYRGVTYRSQAACARAFRIPSNTFNDRLARGVDPVTGGLITPPPAPEQASKPRE